MITEFEQPCLLYTYIQSNCHSRNVPECIQFNSKTLLKDGDPVSLKLIFPGAIQTCEQYNNFSYIYTKQHRFNGQTQAHTTYTFIQNISYLTYTMYIQTCTFTDNNKHVEQERTVRLSMININIVI